MKTITLTNQKGGVGKTTLVVHLAHYLAEQGYRTLVVDLDPQRNTSTTLEAYKTGITGSQLLSGQPFTLPSPAGNLALIEADPALARVDRAADNSPILALIRALESVEDRFDVCVIDTSPTLESVRTMAALFAADFAVAPVEMETYAIEGVAELLKTVVGIDNRKKQAGGGLAFLGMLANKVDGKSPRHQRNLKELLAHYAKFVLPMKVSKRDGYGEAAEDRIPIWQVKKTAAREASKEILEVLAEITKRMKLKKEKAA
ncbi:MAG: hypothetical protein A2X76_01485 [Lysobacterales bacterium GWF1_69_6]|nr:MAG: hypothetical protein A2X76_01485 [Xanthomonadales bacterium GWF1_69_6]